MGLAASQARLLLLTAKNDALELQAQNVEQERLLLAQEQETIAQEYSDKTTNTIYTCRVFENGETQQQTMNLETLAKSQAAPGVPGSIVIADSNGNPIIRATANDRTEDGQTAVGEYEMSYEVEVAGVMTPLENLKTSNNALYKYYQNVIEALNTNGSNSPLQSGIANGAYQLWVQDTAETANDDSTSLILPTSTVKRDENGEPIKDANGNVEVETKDSYFVRKNPESLSSVTSRYYTEDDAAAQAAYNTAMAKVNTLDTRLENKLNQIETQKKAVEQEMESVDSIIQSNIERTFQYFS